MNIVDLLNEQAATRRSHPAVIECDRGVVCTYSELASRVATVAERLAAAGVQRGHVVGLHCPSGLGYIILAYALWSVGATVVPIPSEMTDFEKRDIGSTIALNGIVTSADGLPAFGAASPGDALALWEDGFYRGCEALSPSPLGLASMDAAFVRFTSGTTGRAKGVILSHATVVERIHAVNDGLRVRPGDRVLCLLSMSHHFAASVVGFLSFGATVLHTRAVFGDSLTRIASSASASAIFASPIHYRLMSGDTTGSRLPALRVAISTSMRAPAEVLQGFWKRFGLPLSEAYGIIEVGIPCVNLQKELRKEGSVGRPSPAYAVRVCGMEHGQTGPVEICGAGFFDGYYQPWRPRDEVMSGGWFSTGDVGTIDDDGYLFILGRTNEVINVGGIKVFPSEIEAVLESHSAVKEAQVLGERQDKLGEVPVAHVVLEPGHARSSPAELRRFCSARLASFKVPVRIDVVAHLVRTASGKLLRPSNTPGVTNT